MSVFLAFLILTCSLIFFSYQEFGTEISEKESLQAPAKANETTQNIHQGERDSDSTSKKPIPIEAEPQETTERKKDAPQVLLQEPIAEATENRNLEKLQESLMHKDSSTKQREVLMRRI